jgi:hypothetical protein
MDSQRLQEPTILLVQSDALGSNRQKVLPAFETLAHGLAVPGKWATLQSFGKGTSQRWEGAPLSMPKLQDCSVVAA